MLKITPPAFLAQAPQSVVLDVRSPLEFAAGHIPGAINLPLFDDKERAEVGTLYKKSGREASVLRGLEIAGPKLSGFVERAGKLGAGRRLLIHCWRGGMRSEHMAWLFELAGFGVVVLDGGYKAYRQYIREQLGNFRHVVVLGGKTGSGKTEVIDRIRILGCQVLNLEGIAHHKGSAFGDLGQEIQPTSEQFENNLYRALAALHPDAATFLEDESRGIGRISIPDVLFQIMRTAGVIFLDVPKDERIKRLVSEYSGFPRHRISSAITRIASKLGGLNTRLALEALDRGEYNTVADILLLYYDKAYMKGLALRDQEKVFHLPVEHDDPGSNALRVVTFYNENLAGKFQLPGLSLK